MTLLGCCQYTSLLTQSRGRSNGCLNRVLRLVSPAAKELPITTARPAVTSRCVDASTGAALGCSSATLCSTSRPGKVSTGSTARSAIVDHGASQERRRREALAAAWNDHIPAGGLNSIYGREHVLRDPVARECVGREPVAFSKESPSMASQRLGQGRPAGGNKGVGCRRAGRRHGLIGRLEPSG